MQAEVSNGCYTEECLMVSGRMSSTATPIETSRLTSKTPGMGLPVGCDVDVMG